MPNSGRANLLAVCLLTGFYIYHLFHKGIFGNRLKHETFEWDSRIRAINESTQFIRHAIKNEMIKIEWCARNLAELEDAEHTRYADIIMSSSNHLKEYLERLSKYSGEIHLDIKEYPLSLLLEENLRDMLRLYPDIRIFLTLMILKHCFVTEYIFMKSSITFFRMQQMP